MIITSFNYSYIPTWMVFAASFSKKSSSSHSFNSSSSKSSHSTSSLIFFYGFWQKTHAESFLRLLGSHYSLWYTYKLWNYLLNNLNIHMILYDRQLIFHLLGLLWPDGWIRYQVYNDTWLIGSYFDSCSYRWTRHRKIFRSWIYCQCFV